MDEKEIVYEMFIKACNDWACSKNSIIYEGREGNIPSLNGLEELECRWSVMNEYVCILNKAFGYDKLELYQKIDAIYEGQKYGYQND